MTQYDRIAKLLTRQRGATSMEIIAAAGTVSPHRRLHEMRLKGWLITRTPISGKAYGRYHGSPPGDCYFAAMGDAQRRKNETRTQREL